MKKGYFYIFITTLLFSSMEIAMKIVANQYNPIQLTFIRFFIGALILVPLIRKELKVRGISLYKKDLAFFSLTGFICIVVSMSLYQLSLLYCQASIVAVLFSCNPVFITTLAYFILKEKVTKLTIISIVISIIGMIFILNPWHISGGNKISGMIFVVLSAATFAFYAVIGKSKSDKYGGIVTTGCTFIVGSIEMLILILLTHISFISGLLTSCGLNIFADIPVIRGITLQSIPSLVYIGVLVTGLGYTLYFLAMEKTSAITASVVFFIKPALAPVLAFLIIHESITLNTIVGIILIIAGSSITFISNSGSTNSRSTKPSLKS